MVTLVGHSLGAQNIINLLSQSSVSGNYIAQSVNMAPCLVPEAVGFVPFEIDAGIYSIVDYAFNIYKVESLFGPTWSTDVETIFCLFSPDLCSSL